MIEKNKSTIIVCFIGMIFVIWLALIIAPHTNKGIIDIFINLSNIISKPFNITICDETPKTVLFFLLMYFIFIVLYYTCKKNYRRGEEYGTAKWGIASTINKKYKQKENIILTKKMRLGLDGRKHRRNLNILIVGGSGAGKTRFYAKPNIMQCNTSFVILDPKGEILRDTGGLLKEKGYNVVVLDLINMEKSNKYNPFVYLKNDNDVQRLVTNLFKSTTPKGSQSSDPFWDNSAVMPLSALIYYLYYEAPEEEQNFSMVVEMLNSIEVKEEDDFGICPIEVLFDKLATRNPDHIAVKYYKSYKSGAGKTLKSINITLASRLEKFNIKGLTELTMKDELELDKIGERKTALFALIPDNDTSFNFIVSILYTQLFQQLFFLADNKYNGRLPVHVHFMMDEFANVSLPDDFAKILSVMRSREVSVSIILQNLSQLKALFKDDWESIVGNCDTLLYLGGNEQSTHKFISELMGKESIFFNTYGKSHGRNGSYSTNYQQMGRELMTPDEIRKLDNSQAILFIRGESPIKDKKYNIKKHPNIRLTTDGQAKPFEHGTRKENNRYEFNSIEEIYENYELISNEEIDKYLEWRDKNAKNKR